MPINAEQNQNDNQKAASDPNAQNPSTGANGAATPTSGTSRVASYSSGVAPTQTGSGRFTNLQNYIGANQGASDRLATGISSNLDKQNQPVKQEVDTQASNVRDGIAAAQGKLQTGQGYQSQLGQQDFNADSIAKDPNKLQEFTGFRTNTAIDANGLNNTTNQAQTTANQYQNQLQNQLQTASTEDGRFNLLKNTFGGGSVYQNPYSTGQQRLDNLFLQAGGADNVSKIQQGIQSNLTGAGQILNTLGQNATQVGQIGTDASALAKGLQSGTDAMTNKYVGDIAGTEAAVNKQRAADIGYAGTQYGNLQNGGAIDQNFADQFGINDGQHLYNSLTGKDSTKFINYGKDELHGADELANANQRNYYDSLAKLAGVQNYAITGKGDATTDVNGNPIAAVGYNKDAFQQAQQDAAKGWNAYVGGQDYAASGANSQEGGRSASSGGVSSAVGGASLTRSTLANALEALGPGASAADINNYIQANVNPNIGYTQAYGDKEATRAAGQHVREQVLGGINDQATSGFDSEGFFKRAKILPKNMESGGNFGVS